MSGDRAAAASLSSNQSLLRHGTASVLANTHEQNILSVDAYLNSKFSILALPDVISPLLLNSMSRYQQKYNFYQRCENYSPMHSLHFPCLLCIRMSGINAYPIHNISRSPLSIPSRYACHGLLRPRNTEVWAINVWQFWHRCSAIFGEDPYCHLA